MARHKLEKYLTRQFERQVAKHSVECEQKYRVDNVQVIRRRLRGPGGKAHASGFERTEVFDLNDRLRSQGRKLRLRRRGNDVAVDYVTKPFTVASLEDTVATKIAKIPAYA